MKFIYVFFLFLLTTSANAMCENEKNKGNTLTINNCYGKEVKKSDSKLMQVYSAYKDTLDPTDQKKLLELQRAWISYKMKQCDFEVSSYGSIAGQLHSQCSININNRRISELKYMENCNMAESSNFCSNFRPS